MIDLEDMLRRRQDRLRGRPKTRWEKFRERLPYREEVIDYIGLSCWVIAALCFGFVQLAHLGFWK